MTYRHVSCPRFERQSSTDFPTSHHGKNVIPLGSPCFSDAGKKTEPMFEGMYYF
jgi:hypothetical protein